ncbi:MAG: type II toxin-antitoxin system VapC family toxin [Methylobacterium sp.]|jgi:predicted nucleic acid-binding protein|nr:type II toxin-antitoxin system VapC family toxin [Methylobacterium sp.]
MILTIDASVAIKWIIEEPGTEKALSFLPSRIEGAIRMDHVLLAPTLIALELHNVIAKRCRGGQATFEQLAEAETALQYIGELTPIDAEIVERARFISFTSKHWSAAALERPRPKPVTVFNIYDCVYIAHAQQKKSRLVTADKEQALMATAYDVPVEFISTE